MSVWFCTPSARPPEEANRVLKLWRERGYKIALHVDDRQGWDEKISDLRRSTMGYPGYAPATNALISAVMDLHADAEWFVIGGDDVEPDLSHSAEEIARQCVAMFGDLQDRWREDPTCGITVVNQDGSKLPGSILYSTFGVMQPAGDRWGENELHLGERGSAYVDRVCSSAWLGREFCRRVNQGKGPLWPEYFHMYVDEELHEVASRLGVLWQRRDLIHLHRHWARERRLASDMPAFHRNDPRKTLAYGKTIFDRRKAAGFPGSECIA